MFIAGGTAGVTLANRLTEAGNQTILVLEAGSEPGVVAATKSLLCIAIVLSPMNSCLVECPL